MADNCRASLGPPSAMHRRLVLAALPLSILQGCGNLPQPFRPLPNSSPPPLTNPRGAGIGVLPPTGIEADASDDIAARIATDLQDREILSQTVDRVGTLGFTLEGNLRDKVSGNLTTTLTFDWRLLTRNGQISQRLEQTTEVDSAEWVSGFPEPRRRIADDISSQLVMMFAPPVETIAPAAPSSPWAGISISIQRPQNAPGDGAEALGIALANRLGAAGFKPADDRPDVVLGALVDLSPYDAVQQEVAIVWQVLNADGEILGDVRLDNRIPAGSLDGAWGLAAEAIVEAAWPGILEIISSSFGRAR